MTIDYLLQKKCLATAKFIVTKKIEVSFYITDLNILCKRRNKHTPNVFFKQKRSKFKKFSGSLPVANGSKGGTEINDIHREKPCFTQFSTRMAASDFFCMFT